MTTTIQGQGAPTTAQQRDFAAAMGLPVLLQTVTVGTAQQDIDFTSLDLDADRIYRIELSHIPNAGENQTVKAFYNSDFTDANYQNQFLSAAATTATALRQSTAFAAFGGIPTNANYCNLSTITITKTAGKIPMLMSVSGYINATDAALVTIAQRWSSSVNVTAIKLRHTTLFGVGTVAKIYKL